MVKKLIGIISIILCLSTVTSVCAAGNFDWAQEGVEYCKKYRILQGDERGRLNLGGNLTREQMAKMVAVACRKTGMNDNPSRFSDVTEDMWSYVYIVAIQDYITDQTAKFRPGDYATREEFIESVVFASDIKTNVEESLKGKFPDTNMVSEEKREAMNAAVYYGYIVGDEKGLRPQDRLTRAEACVFLERILTALETKEPVKIPVGEKEDKEDDEPEFTVPDVDVPKVEEPEFSEDVEIITPETEIGAEPEDDPAEEIFVEEKQPEDNDATMPEPTNPKYKMTKTPILDEAEITVEEAIEWAESRGAAQRFIDVAPLYWKYGEIFGIRADVLYAQAAKETAFGNYTGKVKPEMNNWAGIKKYGATGDETDDHDSFATPEDGVRAHFNHMSAYVGVEPVGETHGRYKSVSSLPWAGTVKYVEQLGTKWCPDPNYGYSIMTDYIDKM